MTMPLTRRVVSVSPTDPAISLDSVPPIPSHWGPVIAHALANTIATDTGVVYIACAQDFARLAVTVEIWSHRPAGTPTNPSWRQFPTLTVEWPTHELVIADTIEPDPRSGEIQLPRAGTYVVDAYHRGRDEAATKAQQLREQMTQRQMALDEIRAATRGFDNVEQYLIRMWPHDPA